MLGISEGGEKKSCIWKMNRNMNYSATEGSKNQSQGCA